MGIKQDFFQDGILIKSVDTRTPEEVEAEDREIRNSLRRTDYGAIQDQLDMMYWDQANGTSNWKNHIDAIKAKYPKPAP